jgi:hypothetical protein
MGAYRLPLDFEVALYASTPKEYTRLLNELS